MVAVFRPPPAPPVPTHSKPSNFRHYTEANSMFSQQYGQASERQSDNESSTPSKGQTKDDPMVISSDEEDSESDNDDDRDLLTLNDASRNIEPTDSPATSESNSRNVALEASETRESSQIDSESEPNPERDEYEEAECGASPSKGAAQSHELVEATLPAANGGQAHQEPLHSIDGNRDTGSRYLTPIENEVHEEATKITVLSKGGATQLRQESIEAHATISSIVESSNPRKRVRFASADADLAGSRTLRKRRRDNVSCNIADQDGDESDAATSDGHCSKLQSPFPQSLIGTEHPSESNPLGDISGGMKYPTHNPYPANSKASNLRAQPTTSAKHRKHVLHTLSNAKSHTRRRPRTNKRSIEGNSAAPALPLCSFPRSLQLRSISPGVSFFTATIQTENNTPDPPQNELERLIKGALGYVIKTEDISLQLIVSGRLSTWLITGFIRNDDTSREDSSSMRVSTTSDIQTVDAASREIPNTTDSDDSNGYEDPRDQILDDAGAGAGAGIDGDVGDDSGYHTRRRNPPWTPLEEQRVLAWEKEGMDVEWMAENLKPRTPAAIRSRLYILKERPHPRRPAST